jgi:hypothetical protein
MCDVHRDRLRTVLGYEKSKQTGGVVVRVEPKVFTYPRNVVASRKSGLLDARRRGRRSVISEPGEAELLTTHKSGMCAARRFQRSVANAKLPEVNKIRLLASAISPTDHSSLRKLDRRDIAIAISGGFHPALGALHIENR